MKPSTFEATASNDSTPRIGCRSCRVKEPATTMNMASESNFASALALEEGYDLASFRSPETRQALADFLAARGRK